MSQPLVTGSIRIPESLVDTALKRFEEFFDKLSSEHEELRNAFSHISVSGRRETVAAEIRMNTPQEEQLITAARGKIIVPRPHPDFDR